MSGLAQRASTLPRLPRTGRASALQQAREAGARERACSRARVGHLRVRQAGQAEPGPAPRVQAQEQALRCRGQRLRNNSLFTNNHLGSLECCSVAARSLDP